MKKLYKLLIFTTFVTILTLGTVNSAKAFMPPEFVFDVGLEVVRFFSLTMIVLLSLAGLIFKYSKMSQKKKKYIYTYTLLAFSFIFLISFVSAKAYENYKQEEEYIRWTKESELNLEASRDKFKINKYDGDDEITKEEEEFSLDHEAVFINRDKFKFEKKIADEIKHIKENGNNFIAAISEEGPGIAINSFYKNIVNDRYEDAYEITSQEIDFNEFKSDYFGIDIIKINEITRITDELSSFELIFRKNNKYYRHGVLVTINESKIDNIKTYLLEPINKEQDVNINDDKNGFVILAETVERKIKNNDDDFIIIDTRSDYEFSVEHIPDSINISSVDLVVGKWIDLPQEKDIIVICARGGRSNLFADFLRKKKLKAYYINDGMDTWKKNGRVLIRNYQIPELGDYLKKEKINNVYSTEEVKNKIKEGVVLLDCRDSINKDINPITEKVAPVNYIKTSFNDMTTHEFKEFVEGIAKNKKIIAICDTSSNCSQAMVVGVLFDYYGNEFLGIYNRPWEF